MKLKKIKFKDLDEDWFMLIRRPITDDDNIVDKNIEHKYYVVLRFDRTLLHNHKFVRLLEVSKYYKRAMDEVKMFEDEFNESNFKLTFDGKNN